MSEQILYSQEHVDQLLGEIASLEQRVHRLEAERAKARVDAFTNAARIAESVAEEGYDASALAMARRIAARLRARAAVGTPPPP